MALSPRARSGAPAGSFSGISLATSPCLASLSYAPRILKMTNEGTVSDDEAPIAGRGKHLLRPERQALRRPDRPGPGRTGAASAPEGHGPDQARGSRQAPRVADQGVCWASDRRRQAHRRPVARTVALRSP